MVPSVCPVDTCMVAGTGTSGLEEVSATSTPPWGAGSLSTARKEITLPPVALPEANNQWSCNAAGAGAGWG